MSWRSKNMSMKILLVGFYGEGNLGDETILQAICSVLPPGVDAAVTSGLIAQSSASPIRRRGLASWPIFLQSAASCRHAVFSGGILQDWSFEGVTWFALRLLAASTLGCRASLWGAGLGPLRSRWARQMTKRSLRRVSAAWLRDHESLCLYNALGDVPGQLGADWSWLIPVEWQTEFRQNAPVGLNLRPWRHGNFSELLTRQLRHIERQLIGFPARHEDIRAIKAVAPAASIVQPATFAELAETCRNLSRGLAMRYHAGLAMLRAGLPLKLAAYDDKVSSMAAAAGIETLQQNQITGFRPARRSFCAENEARMQDMKQAFLKMLEEPAL